MQTVSIYATKLRNSLRQTHILQGFRQTQYPNLIEPPTHFQPLNWPILHILCRFFISLQASHYHKSQKRQREKKPHIITCRTSGGPLILPVKMFFFLITLLGWCISCVHLFKRGGGGNVYAKFTLYHWQYIGFNQWFSICVTVSFGDTMNQGDCKYYRKL